MFLKVQASKPKFEQKADISIFKKQDLGVNRKAKEKFKRAMALSKICKAAPEEKKEQESKPIASLLCNYSSSEGSDNE
jgi:hypothetical protein